MTLTIYRADGSPRESDFLATPAAMDPWHLVGAAGEPAFTGGFVAMDAPRNPRFRKYPDGRVRLAGQAKSGTNGSGIFTLPVGYRPPQDVLFPAVASGGTAYIAITSGTVIAYNFTGNVNLQIDLNAVEFDTESVTAMVVPTGQGPPLVTALPVSPTDGQEVHFLADAANGVIWHLRYRAASPSAYKWEFVGGSPLFSWVNASQSDTVVGWQSLATPGPDVVAPLSGDWMLDYGAVGYSADGIAMMSVANASVSGNGLTRAVWWRFANQMSHSTRDRLNGVGQGQTLRVVYQNYSGTSSTYSDRFLGATPVRVG